MSVRQKLASATVLLVGLVLPLPAFAMGGIFCHLDDANLAFSIDAGLSRSGAGEFYRPNGFIRPKIEGLPGGLSDIRITDKQVGQHWFDGRDLRIELLAYDEGDEPYSEVRLTILTRSPEPEALYTGTYELRAILPDSDGTRIVRTGKITCDAE